MSRIYSDRILLCCRCLLCWLLLLPWVGEGRLCAQRFESQSMVILDADGRSLVDDKGRPWDPEDGVWMPTSFRLSRRTDLEVFVTNEVCADSIVVWSKTNDERCSRLVRSFVNEYRQRDWLLHPRADVYELSDVNSIAEAIYAQYGHIVDYWCQQTSDMRGPYSVALVLHPRAGGPFEMVVLNERISLYDGDEPLCPLYYKNRVMLQNVEKVHRVERPRRERQRAQSRGMWLTFDEHFSLRHPSDRRLLVERLVDVCTFPDDYHHLTSRLSHDAPALRMARQLMDHHASADSASRAYMLDPMVFVGERYLMTARRHFRGNLWRDTLEHYRQSTLRAFGTDDRHPLYLSPSARDTVMPYRWQMPDLNHFYSIRHIDYLHDHTHADTSSRQECDCERQMPLQFLRVAASPAGFDCPPRLHGATDQLVSFRPRSRGELQDATYSLALSFEKGSSRLDLRFGSNQQQMDSLVRKAYDITHGDESHSIQRVGIVGISSPEGRREVNLRLSHQRSEALIERLRQMGGSDLRYARFDIELDSIAPWSAVADILLEQHPDAHDLAEGILGGDLTAADHPYVLDALQQLRQVTVTYAFKALMETPSEAILARFWRGDDASHWPAYYFYVLLQSAELTWPEKVQLSQRLLDLRESQVRRYCRDLQPTDSYGLVLPLAANVLAIDAIREGRYDARILAPFIDRRSGSANIAYYLRNDYEAPVKFVNLDVVLYNQVLMLCGIGTDEALDEAYDLAEMLNASPTVSDAFRSQYHPESLTLLIDCQNADFLTNVEVAEAVRQTNICNLFVVNMARIFRMVDGELAALPADDGAMDLLHECRQLLPSLQDQMGDEPAALYFTAVTEAWAAEAIGDDDRDRHLSLAREALTSLFAKDPEAVHIARLQGDSYLRGIYRTQQLRQQGIDLYLEAVEQYILQYSK